MECLLIGGSVVKQLKVSLLMVSTKYPTGTADQALGMSKYHHEWKLEISLEGYKTI